MRKPNTKAFFEKLSRFCRENGFYRDGERTLLGFSGGADSVCLTHALFTLLGRDALVAVHINHMLRGEDADADEAFCRTFCAERGIPFFSRRIDVNALCGGVGFEDAARNARYAVFAETAKEHGCLTVSLAHTASDNLETMLFHLCRGAGPSGLSGIPVTRPLGELSVVRPLLPFTREEILAYLEANGLTYRTDATNDDTHYTRNFIRHEIVPRLKAVNPAVAENAYEAAASLADAMDFIRTEASKIRLENGITDSAALSLLKALPRALRHEILLQMLRYAGGDTLPHDKARAIGALFEHNKKGKTIELSNGLLAVADGEMLRILRREAFFAEEETIRFSIPLHKGENVLEGGILYLDVPPPEVPTGAFMSSVRVSESVLASLIARERRDGESYRAGGMTRILKKHLCGASKTVKRRRPVICDDNGILWFPGLPVRDGMAGSVLLTYMEL